MACWQLSLYLTVHDSPGRQITENFREFQLQYFRLLLFKARSISSCPRKTKFWGRLMVLRSGMNILRPMKCGKNRGLRIFRELFCFWG
jgi:hypothetical protein